MCKQRMLCGHEQACGLWLNWVLLKLPSRSQPGCQGWRTFECPGPDTLSYPVGMSGGSASGSDIIMIGESAWTVFHSLRVPEACYFVYFFWKFTVRHSKTMDFYMQQKQFPKFLGSAPFAVTKTAECLYGVTTPSTTHSERIYIYKYYI